MPRATCWIRGFRSARGEPCNSGHAASRRPPSRCRRKASSSACRMTAARPRSCGDRHHHPQRRDRLPGRRVGIGKVDHLAGDHGPAPRPAESDAGRDQPPGPEPSAADAGAAARPAGLAHRHDLPGADDGAQPGPARRRSDHGGAGASYQAHGRPAQGPCHRHHAPGSPSRCRAHFHQLSASTVGRPAPAHHDRDGARPRSRSC